MAIQASQMPWMGQARQNAAHFLIRAFRENRAASDQKLQVIKHLSW
jgi:hypothetical protein